MSIIDNWVVLEVNPILRGHSISTFLSIKPKIGITKQEIITMKLKLEACAKSKFDL